MTYSAIGILAATVLIIENQDVMRNRNRAFTGSAWRAYRNFLFATLFYYVTDILWGILESLKLAFPLAIDTSANFIAMAFGVFAWTHYAVNYLEEERSRFGKILINFGRIFAAGVSALSVVNIFTPIIFKVNAVCEYSALPLRYVILGSQIIILLDISVYALYVIMRKHTGKSEKYRTFALFGLIMVIFLTLQMWYPYLPLYGIAYMLGTCLLHAFVISDEKEKYRLELDRTKKISEMEHIKKENERTREAYKKVVSVSTVYENIVKALSNDYFNIYYVNIETDEYIEYGSKTQTEHKEKENLGENFFEQLKEDADELVYEEDREELLAALDKKVLIKEISRQGIFTIYYRIIIDGKPTYVSLRATKIVGNDDKHIIIGVTNIDTQMMERLAFEKAKEERKTYSRLNALNQNLMVVYLVDPVSESYSEYDATSAFESLGIVKQGEEFFKTSYVNSLNVVHPDDMEYFHSRFTKEEILQTIGIDGIFVLDYRIIIDGEPLYVRLKATEYEEDDKPKIIIGLEDIDARVRREQRQAHELSVARKLALTDALTGVKNKFVFEDTEKELEEQIIAKENPAFAMVICDINNLKKVNDDLGHRQGDECIREACAIICRVFRHSPVFRIGGDEFAVICRGNDYEKLDSLLKKMDKANAEKSGDTGVQIAYGAARYEGESSIREVFERADKKMYRHKQTLKAVL